MSENRTEVVGGVDTHRDSHVAAAVDGTGRLLGAEAFPATSAGHRELLAWLASRGALRCVGVEGTGSYGAGLARDLAAAGVCVVEVNRPNRQERRRRGKSDTLDAQAAARAALAGDATAVPKTHDGPVEAIRMLTVARRGALKARTAAANQLHGLLTTAPEELKVHLRGLRGRALIDACAALGPDTTSDAPAAAAKVALASLARRHQTLSAETAALDGELQALCAAANPALLAAPGVGPETAAALLTAAGDNPRRLRSEASFAALCGASPIAASSGRTTRHRLNRGGDRHANSALWRIAMVRLRCDPATQAYAARRRAEGKTTRETIRCLKRHIAREIHRLLTDPPPVPHGGDLRRRRTQANITLTAAAKAIGCPTSRLSALERGTHHNATLAGHYQHWLTQNTP
ncbi:MAG: IS110 family transposase [bacterium]|nr:IS110 family transposase [bacterium]